MASCGVRWFELFVLSRATATSCHATPPRPNWCLQLVAVYSGRLYKEVTAVAQAWEAHVMSCPLCRAKAHICEFCNDERDLLFPFETKRIHKVGLEQGCLFLSLSLSLSLSRVRTASACHACLNEVPPFIVSWSLVPRLQVCNTRQVLFKGLSALPIVLPRLLSCPLVPHSRVFVALRFTHVEFSVRA